MLSILYLLLAIWIGDILSRRVFPFASILRRMASAFIVGIFVCTWVNYLGVCLYPRSPVPLLGGNLAFIVFVYFVARYFPREPAQWLPRPPGRGPWDVV